ncbi:MAG: 50S ribosomal protein L18 [Patescibacteria group bacterium]|mgnify:FL=1
MNKEQIKQNKFLKRKRRVKFQVGLNLEIPRLSVYRSNKYIYAQIIDDQKGHTLVSVDSREINKKKGAKTDLSAVALAKVEEAKEAGKLLAEEALKKDIKVVRFDRGGRKYHGRIKFFADGAREGGLKF